LTRLGGVADSLAPMSVTDVLRVSQRSGINPDHLEIFGDELRAIYAEQHWEVDARLSEVERMIARYVPENARAFAEIATLAEFDLESMRGVVEAARAQNISMDDLLLMGRSELLDLLAQGPEEQDGEAVVSVPVPARYRNLFVQARRTVDVLT